MKKSLQDPVRWSDDVVEKVNVEMFGWDDMYIGPDRLLLFGFILLCYLVAGISKYTNRVYLPYRAVSPAKDALDILSERYALGEIEHHEFTQMRAAIVVAMNHKIKCAAQSEVTSSSEPTKPLGVA